MFIRFVAVLVLLMAAPCVWGQVGPDFDITDTNDSILEVAQVDAAADYIDIRLTNDPGESANPPLDIRRFWKIR